MILVMNTWTTSRIAGSVISRRKLFICIVAKSGRKNDGSKKPSNHRKTHRRPGTQINFFDPWLLHRKPKIDELRQPEDDDWGHDMDSDWTEIGEEDNDLDRSIDPRPKQGVDQIPRDSWLIPITGFQGIIEKVTFDEEAVEERISAEWEANQLESRAAIQAIAFMIAVPLVVGFTISRCIAEPVFHVVESMNPEAFSPTDKQKVDGARRVQVEEMRIKMEEAIGHIPPVSEEELFQHLVDEAGKLGKEMEEENKNALLNVISDSVSGIVFVVLLAYMREARRVIMQTTNRVVGGLSESAKAFLIILIADIVLGYHSEEGWNALLNSVSRHYGIEPDETNVTIFVSVVPVFMDACFKYWIFKGLNRKSPGAAVTLRTMNRH